MGLLENMSSMMIEKKLVDAGDRIVLGLSGGGDSVALFVALCIAKKKVDFELEAVHVHHGIRGESADADESYVRELCDENGVPLIVKKVNVPEIASEQGISTELAGRKVRKLAFEESLRKVNGSKLFLAHHANDQEETIFMNFLRGSGLAGLAGMRDITDVTLEDGYTYRTFRPFLGVTHEQLLAGLSEMGIAWREDETNSEAIYTRNRFRLHILPQIKELYPGFTEVVCRNASLIRENNDYISQQAARFLDENGMLENGEYSIGVKALKNAHRALASESLRQAITAVGGLVDVSYAQMEEIYSLLDAQSGKYVCIAGERKVRRSFDKIIVSKEGQRVSPEAATLKIEKDTDSAVNIIKKIENNTDSLYTKWFDCDKIAAFTREMITIRHPEEGDYLIIDREGHTKKLSTYLKGQKIDVQKRKQIEVAVAGHLVLAVSGYRDSCGFEIDENSSNIIRIYKEGV